MAEERDSIRGSDVRLDDRSVAVLHGTPMAQWGDRSLVPAGNEIVLQVAEECIKNSDGQEKGQALAGRVLQDPRIQNAEILFLVPLNGHGKKMRLEVSREAWQTREELFVFTSPQDDNDLKVWLKEPINTLMKTMLQNLESGAPLALPVPSMNESRTSSNTIRTPTNEMCKRLQDMIKNADGTLDDMKARVFNDRDLEYGCLKTLEDAQGQADKAVWSRHWAGKLQEKDQEALDHSDRRRTLLFFLRKVCDLGLTKEGGIAEGQLEALQSLANILTRIYEVVLPMDRANALYCLHNTATRGPGNHWYAKEHWQLMVDLGVIPPNYVDKHTMNRRYLSVLRSEVINPYDRDRLMSLLTPTLSPKIPLDKDTIARAEEAGILVLQDAPNDDFFAELEHIVTGL